VSAGGPPRQAAQPGHPSRWHTPGSVQEELFAAYRHHGFITNSTLLMVRLPAPRPRHRRAGHRRAQGRSDRAPTFRCLCTQRRLARPRGDRVQPRPNRRRPRVEASRASPLGDPAHAAPQRPRPGRLLGQTAHPAPAHRLALGAGLAEPVRRRDRAPSDSPRLTTRPQGARPQAKLKNRADRRCCHAHPDSDARNRFANHPRIRAGGSGLKCACERASRMEVHGHRWPTPFGVIANQLGCPQR